MCISLLYAEVSPEAKCPPLVSGSPEFTIGLALALDIGPMMELAHEGLRPHFEKLGDWGEEQK